MQSSDVFEAILWSIAGIIAGSMVIVLSLGLFKGVFWEQQFKTRRK